MMNYDFFLLLIVTCNVLVLHKDAVSFCVARVFLLLAMDIRMLHSLTMPAKS